MKQHIKKDNHPSKRAAMELLAPAGSFEGLVAAVQNGAGSVYLGGAEFNARRSAENFSAAQLPRAVDYCHARGVKVYCTLNILLLDKELARALDFAAEVYTAGVDALLVQDLGLATLLARQLPELPLHASTQLGVHNPQGAALCAKLGFKRVVLAREVALSDIKLIAQNPIEIEVFAHGAMCAGFSGGCLFSSMAGGRSGNRGMCAQPCRQRYALKERSGYLLSMKDLCMLGHLDDLAEAGVKCIKLEGRMKRPEYVAVVTRAYRRALDGAADIDEEIAQCAKVFNRGGFGTGYYYGNDSLTAIERPNHWGVQVGVVESVSGGAARLRLSAPLNKGDGVEFVGAASHGGAVIPCDFKTTATLHGVDAQPGDRVMRTTDAKQLEAARQSYAGEQRKVPISGELMLLKGERATLTLYDNDGNRTECFGETVQKAQKPPDTERIRAQISKLGDTPFELEELHVTATGFLGAAQLNALRREAVGELIRLRCPRREAAGVCLSALQPREAQPLTISVKARTPEQALAAFDSGVDEVQFAPERYRTDDIAALAQHKRATKLLLCLPSVAMADDMQALAGIVAECRAHIDGAVAHSLSQYELIKDLPLRVADLVPGAMNAHAVDAALSLGFTRAELSGELTMAQMRDIIVSQKAVGVTLYGRETLMYLKHCPFGSCTGHCGALRDDAGREFPLECTKLALCTAAVLNCAVTDNIPKLNELPRPATFRLVLHAESAEATKERIQALKLALSGKAVQASANATSGHWRRGVL